MLALKRLPEKHHAHETGRLNKQKNTNMNTNRKAEETGEQTITCAVQVQVQTQSLINLQSGLKYKSLWQMSRNTSLHYITLGHKTTILIFFPKGLGCSAIGKVTA